MTPEQYDEVEWLPNAIVTNHFSWAWDRGEGNHGRYLERDDLLQEAQVGLLLAWEKYDDTRGTKFSSYAYYVIVNQLRSYVRKNLPHISLKQWQRKPTKSMAEKFRIALSCNLFCDLDENSSVDPPSQSEDFRDAVLQKDWVRYCIGRLRDHMRPKELRMLLERMRGRSYSQIGRRRGITGESARKIVSAAMVRAALLLMDQEETCG